MPLGPRNLKFAIWPLTETVCSPLCLIRNSLGSPPHKLGAAPPATLTTQGQAEKEFKRLHVPGSGFLVGKSGKGGWEVQSHLLAIRSHRLGAKVLKDLPCSSLDFFLAELPFRRKLFSCDFKHFLVAHCSPGNRVLGTQEFLCVSFLNNYL